MNIIAPATSMSPDTHEYRIRGKVVRVFDTNGSGELLPVEYTQHHDDNKFTLCNSPYGKVYAEVDRSMI